MIFLDTHAVIWLYEGRTELFSDLAKHLIDTSELRISPMVVLELKYLVEIKRITGSAQSIISDLENRIGLKIADTPFFTVITNALEIIWTRDPFDRIITAQTMAEQSRLITADTHIREHFEYATW